MDEALTYLSSKPDLQKHAVPNRRDNIFFSDLKGMSKTDRDGLCGEIASALLCLLDLDHDGTVSLEEVS